MRGISTHSYLFGELSCFDSALALDDNDWNPLHVKEETDSGQMEMFDL